MTIWIILLLSLVQGITEFLPISSSGHLILLYRWLGISDGSKPLSILLHISTLISILIYYRKEVWQLIRHPFCHTNRKIIVTTTCTCIVVLILKKFIDSTFSGDYLFVFFIITAILLIISDYLTERKDLLSRTCNFVAHNMKKVDKYDITNIGITYKQAIIIGLTQGIACIPGISRSGSTIAIGRMCGAKDTTRYSFLISIPIIIASFLMEIIEGNISTLNISIPILLIGMIVCTLVGLLSIRLTEKLSTQNKLTYFAYYLIGLSSLLVILSFF